MSDTKTAVAQATPAQAPSASNVVPAPTKMNTANLAMREMGGGALFMPRSMQELVDFATLQAKAGPAIPPPFRGQPGACMAVTMQALRWEMDPFSVIQKAYVTTDKGGNERIAYEAQLIAAVVNTRGPFEHRPRLTFEGEGDKLRCTVTATIRGEREPRTIRTPTVGSIVVKNSPLWKSDPEQQLSYYALRAFGRRVCPEVILGVYSPDELEEMGPAMTDITPPPRPKLEDFQEKPQAAAEPKAEALPDLTEEEIKEADRMTRAAMEPEETSLARGTRLLAKCTTRTDIADLYKTISEELEGESDLKTWAEACAARTKEVAPEVAERKAKK